MQHRKWVGLVRLDPQIDSIKLNQVCLNPCATNSSWFQPYFRKWAIHGALWVAHISFDFLIFKFFSDRLFTKNTALLSNATAPKAFLANFRKWWHRQLDGYESERALGVGGQVCCCSWCCKELDTTEGLKWTELNWTELKKWWDHTLFVSPIWIKWDLHVWGTGWLENYSQPKSS